MKTHYRFITAAVAAIGLLPVSSHADTLVLEIETGNTPFQRNVPDQYSELRERLDAAPGQGEMSIRIFVPGFEQYATGDHEVSLNVGNGLNWGPDADETPTIAIPGLAMTMESPTLGQLEGIRSFARVSNAAGEEIRGAVLLPDESQIADYGVISISDGVVTGFSYGWVEADNPGLTSMTAFYKERREFPIGMTRLTIDVSAFSEPVQIGELVLVSGFAPTIQIDMGPTD